MHSSGWDPAFDPMGKRVATIGNGASGIQVTTEIRKMAAHVDVRTLNTQHTQHCSPRNGIEADEVVSISTTPDPAPGSPAPSPLAA